MNNTTPETIVTDVTGMVSALRLAGQARAQLDAGKMPDAQGLRALCITPARAAELIRNPIKRPVA